MSFYLSPRSIPSSPRSKSPPKKVSPYTPNSPKTRKSDLFVFPTKDLDLNPNSSFELGNKSVANLLYDFSVGIETRLSIVLKQIINFRNCIPLENHVFEKFVSLIDSAAACPSDCQYILVTIPVEMILYKNLIPSKYVLTQLIERAERLLSPENFFVTYKSHQIIPRYHIQEMIRLFKLLLGEETLNIGEFLKDGKVINSKFVELLARSGSIDELMLQEEENYIRSMLSNILDNELEQIRIKREKKEKENEEKQKAALEKIRRDEELRRKMQQKDEEQKKLIMIEEQKRAKRIQIEKQKAAKRKAAKEKAEKDKAEQEMAEQKKKEKEIEDKKEKERLESEARKMPIRKMTARKKAQLERAEREKEIRLRLEKEAKERKEREEREEKERKVYAREAVLQVTRSRNQIAKDQKEKAQRERERLLQIAKEKEAKEREELQTVKPYDIKRASSLQVKDIRRLLNPEEFEDDPGNKHLTAPRQQLKEKGKSEGLFYLTESEKKKRSNSLTPNKVITNGSSENETRDKMKSENGNDNNIGNDDEKVDENDIAINESGFLTPDGKEKRSLELSPVDEKEARFYDGEIILSLSPTQENKNAKEYQSKSIQKFLGEELSIQERIKIGNQMSNDLEPEEREKLMRFAKLFLSWETAYHAVKQVWIAMKKYDTFDINILLSMMPITFADYTVTGLKTFANDEGITIADIEKMYDKLL